MFVVIKNKSATLAHSASSAAVLSKRVSRLLAELDCLHSNWHCACGTIISKVISLPEHHFQSGLALDNWRPCSLCSRADPVAEVRGFVPRKIFEILVCCR